MSTKVKVGIICLVLVLAIIGGSIAGAYFIGRDNMADKAPTTDDTDTTDKTDDNNNSSGGSTSDTTSPVAARYIDADGYGYQTVGNVTYFFEAIDITAQPYYEYYNGTLRIRPYWGETYPLYSTFNVMMKWSYDGVLWSDFKYEYVSEDTNSPLFDKVCGLYQDLADNTKMVYVSYTAVTNCSNPMYVLNDLKSGAFDLYRVDVWFEKAITVSPG